MFDSNPIHPEDWLEDADPASLRSEERALAGDLLHLAKNLQPSEPFAAQLKRELTDRAVAQPAAHPQRDSRATSWLLRLAGTALFAALLFAAIRLIPSPQPETPLIKPIAQPTTIHTPTLIPTPLPGILIAAPLEDCQQMQTAMQQEFGFSFELKQDVPFNGVDPNPMTLDTSGSACGVFAHADGRTFMNARDLFDQMKTVVLQQGYEKIQYWGESNDGRLQEGGMQMFKLAQQEDRRAYLSLVWTPDPGEICSIEPYTSFCVYAPEQGSWDLMVTLAVDPITPVAEKFVNLWLANDLAATEVRVQNGTVSSLITKTFQFDLGAQPIAALDRLLGVTDHNRLIYSTIYIDESYTGNHVRMLLSLFEHQPGNTYNLPDHELLMVKDSSGIWRVNGIEPAN